MKNQHNNDSVSSNERWYYDSCTLDKSKGSYGEMLNKKTHPIDVIISHLSLGEAYANCYLKNDETVDAFVNLIKSLRKYINIVENDGCQNIFREVRSVFPVLSITDAMHLATAINNKCVVVRTTDRDLYGLSKSKLNDLGKKYNLSHFSITQMK